ncbi:DUF4214 domain-containing protein [Microvirga tunisiensis]|uniref:DUF4214 domain-containing protein n=1 Tax=Pannonibacter tanglangensis TaxID=2750084 RepID=A0A7X5F0N2_9HYPH|nr:DUF4214 domain-containing protein [Pannonibacter sp. XCT-53]NBN77628.1 DUF4214 domain-containing protein [Pannonibacter sp. XCT-53]
MSAELIKQYFVNILQRDPTAAESSFWTASVSSGALSLAQVRESLANSVEATTFVDQIIRIYQAAFGRKPDVTGVDGWTDQLRADATALSKIAAGFVNSTEWKNRYGDNTVNDAVLQALYVNVLGRTGSASEIAAWKATGQSMTQILIGFSNSAEFIAKSGPAVTALKLAAGNVATSALNTVFTGSGALFDPAAGSGQTYTLTSGVDTFNGTPGNDTFVAVAATTGGTYGTADTLTGGNGVDTLNLTVDTLAANSIPAASSSGIEIINVRNVSGNAQTVSGNNFSGHTQIWADRSTSDLTINDVASGAAIGVRGNGVATVGAVTATYAAAATSATLVVDGGTVAGAGSDVTINGTGLTAVTITSSGAANQLDDVTLAGTVKAVTIEAATNLTIGAAAGGAGLTGVAAGSTLTIKGAAASVELPDALAANFKSVDASGLAGGATIVLDGDADTTFVGGKGNDVVTTGAILTTGSVAAGEGTADRLVVNASNHINTASLGGKYTGFEVVQVQNGVAQDVSLIAGITSVRLNDGNAATSVTNLNATQAGAITVLAADGAATIGIKDATNVGQIDTVKLTFNDGNATLNQDINATSSTFTLTGIENLEVTAIDQVDITQSAAASASLASVKLLGAGDATFVTGDMATANFAVDGSAATGKLTIDASGFATNGVALTGGSNDDTLTGSAQADILKGGAGKDTILGGNGNDTIEGGDGNDTITGGVGADTLTGGAGADTFTFTTLAHSLVAAADSIKDFVAGTDKIDVTTVPAAVLQGAAYTAAGTGTLATDIATALTAGGGTLAANGAAVVTITGTGAGTYLILNDGTAGYVAGDDAVVNITGITGTLAVADFV